MLDARLLIDLEGLQIGVRTGDITTVVADAIGNAANAELMGGSGVDGAIHRAGGPSIMAELDKIRARIGRCPPGEAVHTGAGNLPAKWVLHAVGPIYRDGMSGEASVLTRCYASCLKLADTLGARSLTLPAISTGVYGYPMDDAARVAISAVVAASSMPPDNLERVTFVLFGTEAFRSFGRAVLDVLD